MNFMFVIGSLAVTVMKLLRFKLKCTNDERLIQWN